MSTRCPSHAWDAHAASEDAAAARACYETRRSVGLGDFDPEDEDLDCAYMPCAYLCPFEKGTRDKPVTYTKEAAVRLAFNALGVLTLCSATRHVLAQVDPKALAQADGALDVLAKAFDLKATQPGLHSSEIELAIKRQRADETPPVHLDGIVLRFPAEEGTEDVR
jgi:hypothetical protein